MNTSTWQNFLKALYILFSTYNFQNNTEKYNVRNLNHWELEGKQQNLYVYKNNIEQFFQILGNYNIDVSLINSTEVAENVPKMKELNKVIEWTLRAKKQYPICVNNSKKLQIRGDFIKMKDISLDFCSGLYKTLEIIATDTIFIDSDFTSDDSDFTLVIMAPKWSIIGTRTIALNGEDGPDLAQSKSPEMGTDGLPGLPGKHGGTFFGTAQTITDGQNLTITSNGGKGGRGQDGAAGLPGRDGIAATTSNFEYLRHEKIASTRWRIYAEKGKKGGRGGNGGRGGSGGNPGEIQIRSISGHGVKIETYQGEEGDSGRGGKGGPGGQNGKNLEATYIICCWSGLEEIENEGYGTIGDEGSDGVNDANRVLASTLPKIDLRDRIIEFKVILRNFLIENRDNLRKSKIESFLNTLDTDSNLSFREILENYEALETQFTSSYNGHRELFPFYENLKKLIESFHPGSEEEKVVLLHVYTSVLSKLNLIEEDLTKTGLIVKLEDYLRGLIDTSYKYWQKREPLTVLYSQSDVNKRDIDALIKDTSKFFRKHIDSQPKNENLEMVNHLLDKLGTIGLQVNKITSKTNRISETLYVGSKPKKKSSNSIDELLPIELPSTDESSEIGTQITSLKERMTNDLDVTKWKVPQVLKRIKYQIKKLSKEEAALTLEVLTQMIDIYKRIESYQKQKTLSDYIRRLLELHWTYKPSATYSPTLSTMKNTITSNMVISEYENSINVIKQHAFPYVDEFFKTYKLNSIVLRRSPNVTAVLEKCIHETESLLYSVFHSINPIDTYLMSSTVIDYDYPFFSWKQENYAALFKKLFSGEEILLKSNIIPDRQYAVHFNWLEIRFKARNETNQKMINDSLIYYSLELTHSGNSYYRCANKTYVITTTSVAMSWSFGRRRNSREPVMESFSYRKLRNGDFILSPYTTWSLKLEHMDDDDRVSFRTLSNFHELVDLELVGRESYLQAEPWLCDRNIERYYELEDPFPEP